MNSAEFDRPIPQALDDDALEAALAEAKQSPDGLLAAMILLEQQEQLRVADQEALEAWIQSQPAPPESDTESFGAHSNEHTEPEEENPLETAPQLGDESLANDALLPDVDAVVDEYDLQGGQGYYEPILASEVTVTTTLNQIVSDVNEAFSPMAASEEVTVLEEAELASTPDPLLADASPAPAARNLLGKPSRISVKGSLPFDWKSISLPVLVGATFASSGASFATVAAGLVLGALVSWLIGLVALVSEQRSVSSHQVMSRATFGVWGAALPVTGHLALRLLLLAGLLCWAVQNQMITMGASDAKLDFPVNLSASGLYAVAVLLALVVFVLFIRVSRVLQGILASTSLALTVLVGVLNFGSMPVAIPDFFSTVTIAVTFFIFDALILGPSRRSRSAANLAVLVRSSLARQLLPAILSSIAVCIVLGMAADQAPGAIDVASNSIYSFIVDLGFLPILFAVCSVGLDLVHRVLEDFASLRASRIWAGVSTVLVSGAGALFLSEHLVRIIGDFAPSLAALSIGATVPYLTEVLMRRGNFHEVSLQRGYAFYRRFGIAALIGYVAVVALGFLVSPAGLLGSGTLGYYLTPLVGPATTDCYLLLLCVIWTAVTSSIFIKHQQEEVSALERRRSEIAGFDVFD
jgi:hypothetical protein